MLLFKNVAHYYYFFQVQACYRKLHFLHFVNLFKAAQKKIWKKSRIAKPGLHKILTSIHTIGSLLRALSLGGKIIWAHSSVYKFFCNVFLKIWQIPLCKKCQIQFFYAFSCTGKCIFCKYIKFTHAKSDFTEYFG